MWILPKHHKKLKTITNWISYLLGYRLKLLIVFSKGQIQRQHLLILKFEPQNALKCTM